MTFTDIVAVSLNMATLLLLFSNQLSMIACLVDNI